MPLKIVRNDITKMTTEAIVNTANDHPTVGTGCDSAVYAAAGFDELLKYRTEKIGFVKEGDAFITPGFNLEAKYIIHAVSPRYNGDEESGKLLRSCYKKSLALAKENKIKSIAFPLISTGSFGYPKEEGLRIALDEINAFLMSNEMSVFIVVFDEESTGLSSNLSVKLERFIDSKYVSKKTYEEYTLREPVFGNASSRMADSVADRSDGLRVRESRMDDSAGARRERSRFANFMPSFSRKVEESEPFHGFANECEPDGGLEEELHEESLFEYEEDIKSIGTKFGHAGGKKEKSGSMEPAGAQAKEGSLKRDAYGIVYPPSFEERLKHLEDTYSEYLMYLIKDKGLKAPEVYNRACIDKKLFSKIKNNKNYHPDKRTALCLCIGAKLNLDQTKDLLARAGYALSPADLTDVIFEFFIEYEIYDLVELDIKLEEHDLPCIIQ